MKSEEVDDIAVKLKEMLAYQNCFHGYADVDCLASELKSALADTERIDWLDKAGFDIGCEVMLATYRRGGKISLGERTHTLREAIDERRKA